MPSRPAESRPPKSILDRDAAETGAAATGEPWQYYGLGYGFCNYTFVEQCPHRMACARCGLLHPMDSSKAPLLDAKDNLQRMLAAIPLTDDECVAVDEGQAALASCSAGWPASRPGPGRLRARLAFRQRDAPAGSSTSAKVPPGAVNPSRSSADS